MNQMCPCYPRRPRSMSYGAVHARGGKEFEQLDQWGFKHSHGYGLKSLNNSVVIGQNDQQERMNGDAGVTQLKFP